VSPQSGARRPEPSRGPSSNLPLPQATRAALQAAGGVDGCSNLSLALNRFVDTWTPDFTRQQDERRGTRRQFLEACRKVPGQQPCRDVLRLYHERQTALLASYSQGPWRSAEVRARLIRRLVIGLGIAHPLEVNLALHRIGGFPYLPGSSVKGATRAMAKELGADDETIRILFGPEPQKEPHAQGALVFFDALPESGFELALEIMNPHHSGYYTGQEPPAEWQSPVPILFLAVDRGAVFRFSIAARCRASGSGLEPPETAEQRLRQGLDWLREALRSGLGGKRSAGYGKFEVIG